MAPAKNKEEMIERGMIPLGQPGNEERDAAVRAKIKGAGSEKGKISAKIRRIKDGTTKNVDAAILELVRNPEMSAIQLTTLTNVVTDKFGELSSKNQIALLKVLNDRYKTLFGGKLMVDADINMNTTDKIMERLYTWKAEGGAKPVKYKAPEVLETPVDDIPIEDTTEVSDEEEDGYEVIEADKVGEE